jgi:hypothetical protein
VEGVTAHCGPPQHEAHSNPAPDQFSAREGAGGGKGKLIAQTVTITDSCPNGGSNGSAGSRCCSPAATSSS